MIVKELKDTDEVLIVTALYYNTHKDSEIPMITIPTKWMPDNLESKLVTYSEAMSIRADRDNYVKDKRQAWYESRGLNGRI